MAAEQVGFWGTRQSIFLLMHMKYVIRVFIYFIICIKEYE